MKRRPLDRRLADPDADQVRRSHAEAITELQQMPAAGLRVIRDVALPDSTEVFVAHGLGRAPAMVKVSPVRSRVSLTAGVIIEYRGTGVLSGRAIDATRYVALAASGYSATITVDVEVY